MSDKPDSFNTLDPAALSEALATAKLDLCPCCHGRRTIGAGYIVGGLRECGQIGGGPHEPRIPCPKCSHGKCSPGKTMDDIIKEVIDELKSAEAKFPPFNSAHEGWAILFEEVEELWEAVRLKDSEERNKKMYDEAVQVAAMGLRFLLFLRGK